MWQFFFPHELERENVCDWQIIQKNYNAIHSRKRCTEAIHALL